MLITSELLKKYKSCFRGVELIQQFYPNGAEMIDIIRDTRISKEMLHWGREHLPYSVEEFKEYCAVCKIINSTDFWKSENIENSSHIVKSNEIKDSKRVFHSSDVINSFDVVYGDAIENSSQIFSSSFIGDCEMVARSSNISNSKNICFSTMVIDSRSIRSSKNVLNSSEIIECVDVLNSYFCLNCKNIKHCMFCNGIENAEYYLFNQPISKEQFKLFEKQYKKFMNILLAFALDWPKDIIIACEPSFPLHISIWYSLVPDKFWKWVRTLPNFDSMFVYDMTMLPNILIDE